MRNKNAIHSIILALMLQWLPSTAQNPYWQWAKNAGGTGEEGARAIVCDGKGHEYIAGYFRSSPLKVGQDNLSNSGLRDVFVSKYDSLGNAIWGKSAKGGKDDEVYSIASDTSGNIYLTGYFYSSTLSFDTITLTNSNTNGTSDIFVAKYDSQGNILWAKSAGSLHNDGSYGITVDPNSNVYITGYYYASPVHFNTETLTDSLGGIFVAKYMASGKIDWVKKVGGRIGDYGKAILSDETGNVYVTGAFRNDTITFGNDTYISKYEDVFLAKYDSSGKLIWGKSAVGSAVDESTCLAKDNKGNIYVGGKFTSESITFGNKTLVKNGKAGFNTNSFVTKYNSSGNVVWAKQIGGTSNDQIFGISTDSKSNIYATGGFSSKSILIGNSIYSLGISGPVDIGVVKFDSSGNFIWVKSLGGASIDVGLSISIDNKDNPHIGGYFNSKTVIPYDTDTLLNSGDFDVFIGRIAECVSGNCVTGLDNPEMINIIKIYPNPAQNILHVDSKGNSTIKITSLLGENLVTTTFNNSTELDIANYTKGLYVLEIQNSETIQRKTVIIQ